MIIILNIGNTHTQMAELRCGKPGRILRFETSRLLAGETLPGFAAADSLTVVAACVVPAAAAKLAAAHPAARCHVVTAASVPGVDFSLVDTSTLGADRMANLAWAAHRHLEPVILVDCGTAITTEVLDSACRFRGGAILPGRRLLRRALHANTGQLPEVPLCDEYPAAVGTHTVAAIRAGIDLGVVGALRLILAESRAALGPDAAACRCLAIGGDADYFVRCIPELEPGGEDFTLGGVAVIARHLLGG